MIRFATLTLLLAGLSACTAQIPLDSQAVGVESEVVPTPAAGACDQDERFREFDFWLGEWQVSDASGTLQGYNTISEAQNGCLLTENWRSAGGGSGQSLSYFSPVDNQWHHRWVSPGIIIEIDGELVNQAMTLEGTIDYVARSHQALFRGKWTPLADGRVEQRFTQSDDDGKSWQVWFVGYYAKP